MTISKNLSVLNNSQDCSYEQEIITNPDYIKQSGAIITSFLKDGCDVVQMPNGDIVIREQKTVATKYTWNAKEQKIVKTSTEIEDQA
jgi:hypothetical protein